jgi:zinc protease
MRSTLLTFIIVGSAVLGAVAAESPTQSATKSAPVTNKSAVPMPTVDEILERNIRALGGKTALLKVTTRSLKGTVRMSGIAVKIPWQLLAKAPNKSLSLLGASGQAELEGFDGRVAWSKAPLGPVKEKTGDELALMKREYEFYRELKLKSLYTELSLVGTETVEGRKAFVLEAKPATGYPERYYYDADTALLLRYDSAFESAGGKVSLRRFFQDYRNLEGVVVPYGVRVEVSHPKLEDTTLTVQCTEIKHNVPMDDSQFEKPAR